MHLRLKIRTTGDHLVATIWLDGPGVHQPSHEILRARLTSIGPAGGDRYHAFVDLASAMMAAEIEEFVGVEPKMLRRRPDYTGERR